MRQPPRYPPWRPQRPELRKDLEPIPGARIEHKRFAIAVHYRNVARAPLPRSWRRRIDVDDGMGFE